MHRQATLIIALLALTVSSCDLFEDETVLEISTDRSIYQRGATIKVMAKNVSSDVIYYNSCMAKALQEMSDDDDDVVETIGFGVCQCLCITQLEPDETWEWSMHSGLLWGYDDHPEPKFGPRYRFLFGSFFKDRETHEAISPSERVTNTFRFVNPAQ